jgi:TolB protein
MVFFPWKRAAIVLLVLLAGCPGGEPRSGGRPTPSPTLPQQTVSPSTSPSPVSAGAPSAGPGTQPNSVRVMCRSSGGPNSNGGGAFMDAQARYVAYASASSNLVPGDKNGAVDAFVRDLRTSCLERVSVSSNEREGNGQSQYPTLSTDGRYVAFSSRASNLVSGDTNGVSDIFVRDRMAGRTERVSLSTSERQANDESTGPMISANGRFVAFLSRASNLSGDTAMCPWNTPATKSCMDVFIRDRMSGTTELISVSSLGASGDGDTLDSGRGPVDVSPDGRFVAFSSKATNLVPGDSNQASDVFLRDRSKNTTIRVSVSSSDMEGDGASRSADVSPDGRLVVFESLSSNFAEGDAKQCADGSAPCADVFVRDTKDKTTKVISVAVGSAGEQDHSRSPVLSADGRYVAYSSQSAGVAGDDTDDCSVFGGGRGCSDTYRYDLVTGRTILVSIPEGDLDRGLGLHADAISAHGRHVLMSMDECGCLFLRDIKDGTTTYLSDPTRPIK